MDKKSIVLVDDGSWRKCADERNAAAPEWGKRCGPVFKQRVELIEAFEAGAIAAGFASELWTLPLIGCRLSRTFSSPSRRARKFGIVVLEISPNALDWVALRSSCPVNSREKHKFPNIFS